MIKISQDIVVVRGAGDLASGILHMLVSCGIRTVALEVKKPSAIRRQVAFSEAIYEGTTIIEGVLARKVTTLEEINHCFEEKELPIIVDPSGEWIEKLSPKVVIDAIIAKKNCGTSKEMADLVIALGPGFCAGEDVDLVIETKRGHTLGKIITSGYAVKNTGIPGIIAGYGKERVIHSPSEGIMKNIASIGDIVKKGEVIAYIDNVPVYATLDGILRGLIRDGFYVTEGFKIADIDPRYEEIKNCFTISDKARTLAGSVLQSIVMYA